jgi:HEAT repeat protein
MHKLVEREDAPQPTPLKTAPALAVQFFLIPLAVVAVLVAIYTGFQLLVSDERTAQEYLDDVRTGGRERRWPAAFELSRMLADPNVESREPGLAAALLAAFRDDSGDDPRVRRYLALALGRLKSPAPGTVPALLAAASDADVETAITAIWALGSLGDVSAVPKLMEMFPAADPEVRKVIVYVLGALPGDAQTVTLATALEDPVADVRWNAAIALARHGSHEAVPVLRQMLDRDYVERTVRGTPAATVPETDRVDEIMISSLRMLASLKDETSRDPMTALSRDDRSLRVRQAALEALEEL